MNITSPPPKKFLVKLIVPIVLTLPLSSFAKNIINLQQSDFDNGTYQIKQAGTYRLTENISFNPHPVGSLAEDGITVLDAYSAGRPFNSQLGNPDEGKYDHAAYGIGFFAAITIETANVTLDLNGYTLEQSAEHALHQRFFAVIELADQPFIPTQGPHSFGEDLDAAENTTIINGTIGRSSHHGIHGNANKNITIKNVNFEDFEVAAVALNGVQGLNIKNSYASNREDVPILGTFSNAKFISSYVDWLVMSNSPTTLTVNGHELSATDIQAQLRISINNVFEDVITDGEGFIDESQHPNDYALYHNRFGIIDGNSYGYLINPMGVAVNGFPEKPEIPASDIHFKDVHILSQQAFINEVIAIKQGGKPAIDPVGAVFMLRNQHPISGAPVTMSSLDENTAVYTGNVLANAQALVAKASFNNEFPSFLDTSRMNITPAIVEWIESGQTLNTLATSTDDYLCNGDSMFHVNKGVVGFKIDGASSVTLKRTSANNMLNKGEVGSAICGDYVYSNAGATLPGYGGAMLRGYSFAGSSEVKVAKSRAINLQSQSGSVIGFDVITNSSDILITKSTVFGVNAGYGFAINGGPNALPDAIGVQIAPDASDVKVNKFNAALMMAHDDVEKIRDNSL